MLQNIEYNMSLKKTTISECAERPGRYTANAVSVVVGEGHVELNGGERGFDFYFMH